jgi:hypothetical protein
MDFCDDSGGAPFTSSVISPVGGGSDPTTMAWGARRINLSMSDVRQTIQEGRASGPIRIWNIEGNPQIGPNN